MNRGAASVQLRTDVDGGVPASEAGAAPPGTRLALALATLGYW
jgi:hypothetical protein